MEQLGDAQLQAAHSLYPLLADKVRSGMIVSLFSLQRFFYSFLKFKATQRDLSQHYLDILYCCCLSKCLGARAFFDNRGTRESSEIDVRRRAI
jgi:hypothetical protein